MQLHFYSSARRRQGQYSCKEKDAQCTYAAAIECLAYHGDMVSDSRPIIWKINVTIIVNQTKCTMATWCLKWANNLENKGDNNFKPNKLYHGDMLSNSGSIIWKIKVIIIVNQTNHIKESVQILQKSVILGQISHEDLPSYSMPVPCSESCFRLGGKFLLYIFIEVRT